MVICWLVACAGIFMVLLAFSARRLPIKPGSRDAQSKWAAFSPHARRDSKGCTKKRDTGLARRIEGHHPLLARLRAAAAPMIDIDVFGWSMRGLPGCRDRFRSAQPGAVTF
ncbi:hypothetical protein D9M70_630930 [compost metagenome]